MIYHSLSLLAADLSVYRRRHDEVHDRPRNAKIILTSLHGDPIHPGHTRCLKTSAALGSRLVVVVNDTPATVAKKGYEFLPGWARAEMIHDLAYVDDVLLWPENTVEQVILAVKPDVFSKGGDRSSVDRLDAGEVEACRKVGTELVLGVGGSDKVFSSSELVRKAALVMGWTPPK